MVGGLSSRFGLDRISRSSHAKGSSNPTSGPSKSDMPPYGPYWRCYEICVHHHSAMSKIVGAVIPVLCCLFVGPNPGARMMKVVSANYPASVIQNHLQAVYDLRESGAVGPRSSITKVLGRTPFPAN